MVRKEGKRGVRCGASLRSAAAFSSLRKRPTQTLTFHGELPPYLEGQVCTDVQYSLGKHKRWELLNASDDFDRGTITLVQDPPHHFQRKSVQRKHIQNTTSTCEAHVQTPTFKDTVRHPKLMKRYGYRELRWQNSRRPKDGRAPKHKEWLMQLWEAGDVTANIKEDVFSKKRVANTKATHPPPISQVIATPKSQKPQMFPQGNALCNLFGWRSRALHTSELPCFWVRGQDPSKMIQESIPNGTFVQSQCIVCFERPASLYDAGCSHPMCLECWGQHAQAQIDIGNADLKCAAPGCARQAPEAVLKCILPASSWRKVVALRSDASVASNPLLCHCPTAGCGKILCSNTVDAGVLNCSCGASLCPKCKGPAHWPASCGDRRWWDVNHGSLIAVQPDNKVCPSCFVEIEKNGGCNHMRCRMCNNNFCWQCGSFSWSMAYHKAGQPCVPKRWWTGALSMLGSKHCVPDILRHEGLAQATTTRMQNIREAIANHRANDYLSQQYASGLTAASVTQQESNVREADLLIMHTLLRYHLAEGVPSSQVENALNALRDYIASMSAFITSSISDRNRMKTLKKRFQQKPRRFVDRVRQLKVAISLEPEAVA